VPGRPVIYATTPEFLDQFGLASRRDLPGIDELRAAGLLDPVDDAMEAAMRFDPDDEPEDPADAQADAEADESGLPDDENLAD
jgi:segregation and condensation protein B